MSILGKIQTKMEEVYGLPSLQPVQDYLIDETTARSNHPDFQDSTQETLLVWENHSEIRIGLYIEERLLKRLETTTPFEELDHHNLDDFCTAIEGVSHFLFVLTRLRQGQPVSALELELQAEIDKFVICTLIWERQRKEGTRDPLTTSLFENYHLVTSSLQEEHRYHLANRLAWQYCRTLAKISHPLLRARWVREIRHFRHKGLQDKIHMLTSARLRSNFRR